MGGWVGGWVRQGRPVPILKGVHGGACGGFGGSRAAKRSVRGGGPAPLDALHLHTRANTPRPNRHAARVHQPPRPSCTPGPLLLPSLTVEAFEGGDAVGRGGSHAQQAAGVGVLARVLGGRVALALQRRGWVGTAGGRGRGWRAGLQTMPRELPAAAQEQQPAGLPARCGTTCRRRPPYRTVLYSTTAAWSLVQLITLRRSMASAACTAAPSQVSPANSSSASSCGGTPQGRIQGWQTTARLKSVAAEQFWRASPCGGMQGRGVRRGCDASADHPRGAGVEASGLLRQDI